MGDIGSVWRHGETTVFEMCCKRIGCKLLSSVDRIFLGQLVNCLCHSIFPDGRYRLGGVVKRVLKI